MASRKIKGTKHVRRRKTGLKATIGVVALAVVAITGFLFFNKLDKGEEIKEQISSMNVISEEHGLNQIFGAGSTPSSKVESIIKVSTDTRTTSDPEDFSRESRFIDSRGGYISGGGTLTKGEFFEIKATPFPGYKLAGWLILSEDGTSYNEKYVSGDKTFKIGYGSTGYAITSNTKVIAVFAKEASTIYKCTLDIEPRVGRFKGAIISNNSMPVNYPNMYAPFEVVKDTPYDYVELTWGLTYEELEQNFGYTTESYSYGENSSHSENRNTTDQYEKQSITNGYSDSTGTNKDTSVTLSKTYNIEYDVVLIDNVGNVVSSDKNKNYQLKVNLNTITSTGVVPVSDAMSKTYDVLTGGAETFRTNDTIINKGDCRIVIVPHTKQGGTYQVITVADPLDGGTTSGDKISSSQFSSSISAEPAKGYKFDHWSWIESTGDSTKAGYYKEYFNKLDSKDKTLTVSPNGVVVYTAHFVPEYYTVDLESVMPEDGGTIRGLGDYAAHENVKITLHPSDGYKVESWKYTTTDGNTFTGDSEEFTINDITSDIKVAAKFTSIKSRIDVKSSPVDGGVITVRNTTKHPVGASDDKPEYDKQDYEEFVSGKEDALIIATPNDTNGYMFRYFEDQSGNKYNGVKDTSGAKTVWKLNVSAVNGKETYKAVFGLDSINLNIKVDPNNKKAGGFKVEYTKKGETNVTTSPDYYDETLISEIQGGKTVKITAIDGDGYHFVKFVDTDGNISTDNPLIYPDLTENKNVEIIFVPDRFTINAHATPVIGGKANVSILDKTTKAELSKREGSNDVSYGDIVRITAIPNGNYAFRYFEDPNGSKYGAAGTDAEGHPYFDFNAVNGSETYKAVFAMDNVHLSVKVDPNTTDPSSGTYVAGSFKVNYTYNDITTGKDINTDKEGSRPNFVIDNIKGQTSVKITAIENGGYKFSKFIDSEGNAWNDNPMVLGNLVEDKDIEVIFVKEHWKILGASSPEAGGRVTLNGVESGLDVDYGDHVSIQAIPNDGYRFKFFKDELGNEFLANPLEFDAINGSEKYTAYFAKDDVSITVDLAPEGSGTVRFNSQPAVSSRTTYSTGGAKSVSLTATPKEDVEFLHWKDQDGNTYNDNPLVITDVSRDLSFTAIFDTKFDTIRAVASPASGGKIRKIINDDGSVTLVATANRGYDFIKWEKPKGITTAAYKFTIPADQVHKGDLYTAIFKINKNYDAKSDITKEKFYREWRKVITPNYTVTRDSMKLLAMQTVAGLRQYNDATPSLGSYGAFANAKAYFDERVAADVARLDRVFGDSELMTVEGEILTPDLIPDQDKYYEYAEAFTDKKFGDHYDTKILTVKRVLEPEEFDNVKRTYLWRYTGAEYNDNIYLLYNINNNKTDCVTPIVDEDGVLKFTIDELPDNDVVAVVRVKIK
ncbi:MAG: hypothetical protein Q4D29_07035 [Lachnospiraceae bacterium]|nr:hypothetical protein [Lachnospiraceae bacterium]